MDFPTTEPSWKRLFSEGGFAWSFRMRPGDARTFFAPQDEGGNILPEKRRALLEHPTRYCAATPAAPPLIDALCGMAASMGLLAADAPRDLRHIAGFLEPDILLMDSATMVLVAGCVCMPSSWSLGHAIGKPMHAVHDVVPRLNPQIGDKIGQFLNRIPQGKAFLRENWSLTRTPDHDYHPDLGRPRLDSDVTPDDIFLRIEHQLFTALPGGILMGLRIETCPFAALAADPVVWRNLTEIIRTMPDNVAGYKGMRAARDPLVERMLRYGA
jgi:hypothetical protein